MKEEKGLNISARSFVIAIAVIFVLMIASYVLTFVIPAGSYDRVIDEAGNTVIDTSSQFRYVDGGLPFWKFLLSPILILGADGSATLIAIMAFVVIIGGVFNALMQCGVMNYMLGYICCKFGRVKYRLMAMIILFFMLMGALVGSFEEVIPMVPIVVALSVSLGWDALTGLGMSLIAVGSGFASGLFNPFTVGVAQSLSGIPVFSGAWLRAITLLTVYPLVLVFVRMHAKKVDTHSEENTKIFERIPALERSMRAFIIIMGTGILIVLSSSVLTFLQDYTIIIIALTFLAAGLIAPALAGLPKLGRVFLGGLKGMLPAVAMILMASSIRYILEEADIIDTLLHGAVGLVGELPRWAIVLFIYLIVLVMNFFVGSGSAKAFMLIPLLVPMAKVFGISAQLCVVAFACGDGFSNIFYPTNAATLISLGLADVDYGSWAKWTWKFQLAVLVITSGILMLGLYTGY